jgi:hypothetical protein
VPSDLAKGWKPDPTGRHPFRWWDGRRWTDNVGANGINTIDPYDAAIPVRATPTASPASDARVDQAKPDDGISFFGARKRARELTVDVSRLRSELASATQRGEALAVEISGVRQELAGAVAEVATLHAARNVWEFCRRSSSSVVAMS